MIFNLGRGLYTRSPPRPQLSGWLAERPPKWAGVRRRGGMAKRCALRRRHLVQLLRFGVGVRRFRIAGARVRPQPHFGGERRKRHRPTFVGLVLNEVGQGLAVDIEELQGQVAVGKDGALRRDKLVLAQPKPTP